MAFFASVMLSRTRDVIQRWPFATTVAFASTRGFMGDAFAQRYEHKGPSVDFVLDGHRSLTYIGWSNVACFLMDFSFYAILIPRWWPTYVAGSFSRVNVCKAVAFDAIAITPLAYFPAFYVFKDCFQAKTHTVTGAVQHYLEEFFPQNGFALLYWTPANILMFGLVKPQFRVASRQVRRWGMLHCSRSSPSPSIAVRPLGRTLLRRRLPAPWSCPISAESLS